MRNYLYGICFSMMLLLLSACASTSLTDTWRNPDVDVKKLSKLMVVSMDQKIASRRVTEDIIAAELRQRGVEAFPAYPLLGEGKATDKAMEQAVAKAGAEGVLAIQTTNVQRQTSYRTGYYPGYWYPSAFPSWNLYGYYGSGFYYYDEPYVTSWELTTVQASLFDAGTGRLRWAATIQSYDPERNIAFSRDIAKIVTKELAREGII